MITDEQFDDKKLFFLQRVAKQLGVEPTDAQLDMMALDLDSLIFVSARRERAQERVVVAREISKAFGKSLDKIAPEALQDDTDDDARDAGIFDWFRR